MSSPEIPTPRRDFLGQLAVAGVTLGLGATVTACAQPAAPAPKEPETSKATDPRLEAWFGKITGKHKVVFDAPKPNEGMPAIWPRVYLNTTAATFGDKDGATAVLILRHEAIPLAMNDTMWEKYSLGELFKINDKSGKPAKKNIYATITDIPLPGIGVDELLKGGVLVGACDLALTVYSGAAAEKAKRKPEEVKAEWIANLLGGVQVVPSGVLGVTHAQELGCTYCFAG